jgi:hypothetical protein
MSVNLVLVPIPRSDISAADLLRTVLNKSRPRIDALVSSPVRAWFSDEQALARPLREKARRLPDDAGCR